MRNTRSSKRCAQTNTDLVRPSQVPSSAGNVSWQQRLVAATPGRMQPVARPTGLGTQRSRRRHVAHSLVPGAGNGSQGVRELRVQADVRQRPSAIVVEVDDRELLHWLGDEHTQECSLAVLLGDAMSLAIQVVAQALLAELLGLSAPWVARLA